MQFPTSPRPLSSIQLPSWPKVLPAFLPRAQKHGLASPQEPQSPVYQPTVVIWKPAELHKTSQRNIRASTSEQATPPPKTPTPRQKKPKQTGSDNPGLPRSPKRLHFGDSGLSLRLSTQPFSLQATENKNSWLTSDPFSWKHRWLSLLSRKQS